MDSKLKRLRRELKEIEEKYASRSTNSRRRVSFSSDSDGSGSGYSNQCSNRESRVMTSRSSSSSSSPDRPPSRQRWRRIISSDEEHPTSKCFYFLLYIRP